MSKLPTTIVVAVERKQGMGLANQLPWHLPEDLAHFKRVTSGHPIVMGRKTFDSIGRPLPNRRNIVITRNPGWQHEGVEVADSVEQAMAMIAGTGGCIIGGAQIFEASLPLAQKMIVTEIHADFPCDTFFPTIDPAQWRESAREHHHSEKAGLDFDVVQYERIA